MDSIPDPPVPVVIMSSSLSELECFFPLRNIDEVNKLFREEIKKRDPDLAMLSIIIGALEHQFTQGKNATASVLGITGNAAMAPSSSSSEAASTASMTSPCQLLVEPPLSWSMVEALKAKFESVVAGFCDSVLLRDGLEGGQIRPLVKHVADIVWNTLTKSHYKDRPHLQSIYSYLTGEKKERVGPMRMELSCFVHLQTGNSNESCVHSTHISHSHFTLWRVIFSVTLLYPFQAISLIALAWLSPSSPPANC